MFALPSSSLALTIFANREAADALVAGFIADGASADEHEVVLRSDGRFVIACYDEEGNLLGNL